jgi:hypothetical protein
MNDLLINVAVFGVSAIGFLISCYLESRAPPIVVSKPKRQRRPRRPRGANIIDFCKYRKRRHYTKVS